MPTATVEPCQLLSLPIELRLEIYDYLVQSSDIITIGTAELLGPHHEIIHRQYACGKSPAKGIPPGHEDLILNGYNANLLHPTRPAKIHLPRCNQDQDGSITPITRLRLVCRQTARELAQHFPPNPRPAHLFLSYPYGLHILHSRHPALLQQARTIHLIGVYRPTDYSPARAATCPSPSPRRTLDANSSSDLILEPSDIATELTHLLTTIFPPTTSPHHDQQPPPALPTTHLHLRIHYPGVDSYSTIWGDEASPIVLALRGIPYGEIKLEIWRGKWGNGVDLRVGGFLVGVGQGEEEEEEEEEKGEWMKRRVVQTSWRRLEGEEKREGERDEGRDGVTGDVGDRGILPAWAEWVVNPGWPEVEGEGEHEHVGMGF